MLCCNHVTITSAPALFYQIHGETCVARIMFDDACIMIHLSSELCAELSAHVIYLGTGRVWKPQARDSLGFQSFETLILCQVSYRLDRIFF